jgi:hypothetical protein
MVGVLINIEFSEGIMIYIFETVAKNYEDFASGRVLFNQHGTTSFPARLGSEIYLRCVEILHRVGEDGPYSIYDPCCGGAYLLTTIGFLHGNRISRIFASDIDDSLVALADRNLSLLSLRGIEQRINQIEKMIFDFGKTSHTDALQSAMNLKVRILARETQITTKSFIADATKEKCIAEKIDIVITDLPYGRSVQWGDMQDKCFAIRGLLDNLIPLLTQKSIIAIVSDKKASFKHEQYKRVEWFQIGKRKVSFLRLAN